MIAGVNGVLAASGEDWVQVTVSGVTYQIQVPAAEILTLGPLGSQVQLFTHLRIRDEHPILYGFTSQAALDLFLVQPEPGIYSLRLRLTDLESGATVESSEGCEVPGS